jgi:hypothetical protein
VTGACPRRLQVVQRKRVIAWDIGPSDRNRSMIFTAGRLIVRPHGHVIRISSRADAHSPRLVNFDWFSAGTGNRQSGRVSDKENETVSSSFVPPVSYHGSWRRDFLVAACPTKLANDPVKRSSDALSSTDFVVLRGCVPKQGEWPFLGAMRQQATKSESDLRHINADVGTTGDARPQNMHR